MFYFVVIFWEKEAVFGLTYLPHLALFILYDVNYISHPWESSRFSFCCALFQSQRRRPLMCLRLNKISTTQLMDQQFKKKKISYFWNEHCLKRKGLLKKSSVPIAKSIQAKVGQLLWKIIERMQTTEVLSAHVFCDSERWENLNIKIIIIKPIESC